LVIELDGGQHAAERDAARTAEIAGRGYRVIRFWNNEVVENLEGVLESIALALSSPGLSAPKGQRGDITCLERCEMSLGRAYRNNIPSLPFRAERVRERWVVPRAKSSPTCARQAHRT
jgi:hypothetical protein